MADGADDGSVASRDRATQRLIGERQQVFDAAAAAGDDDHVDLRVAVQVAQRLDDLGDRVGSLHDRVAHVESHCRPATRGDGHHVTLGGRGPAGDQPDGAGQERERPLEPRIEQPFGVQQLAQPLDAGEQLADTDGANLVDPQRERPAANEEVRPSQHDHLSALGEFHRCVVNQLPRAGDLQRHVGGWVAQRDVGGARVRANVHLGDLTLDPNRAQLVDPTLDHHRFSCPSPYLFGHALREFASATVSETMSPSPVFGSSSSRYLFSMNSLVAFSSNFINAGLSSKSCAVVFVF